MTLAARLRRERTNAASKPNLTFYAPGNMTLPYGKLNLTVGGRGTPGNSPVPGNVANYNPTTPGNVANYNPSTPGTSTGRYNPTIPGNYAGYYNPGSGGNFAGYNPSWLTGSSYTDYYDNTNGWHDYSNNDHPWSGYSPPASYTYTANGNYPGYSVVNFYVINSTPGNAYYNPYYPGYAVYNPATPGTLIYNPTVPGNANYNPSTPGTANYNPTVSGNVGPDSYSFGVKFPGGAIATTAPLVPDTQIVVPYQNAPVAVYAPPGGSVTIKGI